MEIREYDMMTDEARGIRTAVFVVEKDYRPEFDEWDEPGRAGPSHASAGFWKRPRRGDMPSLP